MEKSSDTSRERPWKNVFERYFNQLLFENKPSFEESGPFISISRNFGCMANDLARRLCQELNRLEKKKKIK